MPNHNFDIRLIVKTNIIDNHKTDKMRFLQEYFHNRRYKVIQETQSNKHPEQIEQWKDKIYMRIWYYLQLVQGTR